MWQRSLLSLTALLLAGNGAHMLFAPAHWYGSIESVAHTGPFNAHFVRDIGCAYLAAALGLGLGAWRTRWQVPGALTALSFLGAHALLHLTESFLHTDAANHAGAIDTFGVYVPALIALAVVVLPARSTEGARP
jgi:hypothetical protein